jgi:UDP-N-acetylmuramate--alanine ligase
MLVNKIKEKNPNVCFIEDFTKIIDYLDKNIEPNDLIISIGAGPINTNVTKKLIEK